MTQKTIKLLLLVLLTAPNYAQNVGVGTITPNASAMLDITSTTQGFLPPRMTQTQMNAIASPAEGLLVYCTDCSPKGMYAYNGVSFTSFSENPARASLTCGSTVNTGTIYYNETIEDDVYTTLSYTNGNGKLYQNIFVASTGVLGLVATSSYSTLNNGSGSIAFKISGMPLDAGTASFTITIGGSTCTFTREVIVPTITSSTTGRIWMDRNLGASRQALSNIDVDSYGDLYQWGRTDDGHQLRNSAKIIGPVDLGSEGNAFVMAEGNTDWLNVPFRSDFRWNSGTELSPVKVVTNDPCPTGFRVPTITEWTNELAGFSPADQNGAYSALKLPRSGYKYSNGNIQQTEIVGKYWSSSTNGTQSSVLYFANINFIGTNDEGRQRGNSVRCIQEL